ncbi:MAG: DUF983 domain-containing protein [Alphaproteobacteria bacterium]|nr:DUF983 domain-containing protein [Alphaproteobacteria bacterium]
MQNNRNVVPMMTAIMRGVCNRCPHCGVGKLLISYLKPVAECAVCGEVLGTIRADDGPPWLTILIVGHILLPIIFTKSAATDWPQWLAMTIWVGLAIILMALILPRAKGLFIGVLWKNRQPA